VFNSLSKSSRVTGPLRGVIVKCSRGKGGPGDILPLEWRCDRGGEVPGVGEVDLGLGGREGIGDI
jgi:hypothetical protein